MAQLHPNFDADFDADSESDSIPQDSDSLPGRDDAEEQLEEMDVDEDNAQELRDAEVHGLLVEAFRVTAVAITDVVEWAMPFLNRDTRSLQPFPTFHRMRVAHLIHGSDEEFRVAVRMDKVVFWRLHAWCMAKTTMGRPKQEYDTMVRLDEQLMIFLKYCGHKETMASSSQFWGHSKGTICRVINECLVGLHRLFEETVRLPGNDYTPPDKVGPGTRYHPWFSDCVGAIDGTFVRAFVRRSLGNKEAWRCRKDYYAQNVLGVCDFNSMFTYCLAGWEGRAHDAKIFDYAVHLYGLTLPRGKYLLADSGYPLTSITMTPYPRTRYHLREFNGRVTGREAQNKEELFNHRHSSLRMTIEQVWGVFKRRWGIWRSLPGPEYSIEKQILFVEVLMGINNFINGQQPHDMLEQEIEREMGENPDDEPPDNPELVEAERVARLAEEAVMTGSAEDSREMSRRRDVIASQMWEHELATRRLRAEREQLRVRLRAEREQLRMQ